MEMPRVSPITPQQAQMADRMIAVRKSAGWSKTRFAKTLKISFRLLHLMEAKRMPWTLQRLRTLPFIIDDEIKELQAAFREMRETLADIDPPDPEHTRLWILKFLEASHPYCQTEDRLFADLNFAKPQLLRLEVLRGLLKGLEAEGHIVEWKPPNLEGATDAEKLIHAALALASKEPPEGRVYWRITPLGKEALKARKIAAGWRNVK